MGGPAKVCDRRSFVVRREEAAANVSPLCRICLHLNDYESKIIDHSRDVGRTSTAIVCDSVCFYINFICSIQSVLTSADFHGAPRARAGGGRGGRGVNSLLLTDAAAGGRLSLVRLGCVGCDGLPCSGGW